MEDALYQWKTLVLVAALTGATVFADTNLDIPYPYNCSTRVTCSSLRLRLPNENEEFNAKFVSKDESQIFFNLTNKRGEELAFTLTAVENQRFRIIIEEHDRHRYNLEYSLEKEPNLKLFKTVTHFEGSLLAEDYENNQVVVEYTPLTISFYHDEVLETVFEGNRIIVENTEDSQAFTFAVQFPASRRLFGLHEHVDYLKLRHTADYSIDPYRLRNTDYGAMEYVLNTTRSMYGSIPVIYGFGDVTSGIFHNNAAEQWIEINNQTNNAYFMVDGGRLDLFVLLGPSLKEVVRQYIDLTGKPHLPQLWALGYHQCRWAYNTTEDVMETINNFDKYDFPLDVLWLDIEYTSERKWFTWNATSFPDPVELLEWVDSQAHRKLVPISDPHIKIDFEYNIYRELLENDYFVLDSEGRAPFVGECWPGNTSWVDYFNPAAREYYGKLHLYKNFPSTPALGGFWNDMNEPTLFDNLYERTFPFDLIHYGGVRHRDVHNIYGMLQTMSTHAGLIERDNGTLRPFILSRAYFAGSQRYANKWSGDNMGRFDDLRFSIPMALTSNLVGLAFYGADIPGFFAGATEELLIRWYELGIWLPFFRAHAANGTPRREPFLFGNETQEILRDHMKLRYKHLPYWYTVFYEHTVTGDPIVRALLYQYPEDPVGSDILVASVYESEATSVQVYFPDSTDFWYQITGEGYKFFEGSTWAEIPVNMTYIPVFYRSGSIIVRTTSTGRSSAYNREASLELHVVPDRENNAVTRLYIDDYESFDYVNRKEFYYVELNYQFDGEDHLTVTDLDEESIPGDVEFPSIDTVHIYERRDDGVTVKTLTEDRNGNKLSAINLFKQKKLL
ncbi:hypothetical protein D910_07935 [Dendroctonus ponderosae]|uniref:Glucosidase II subunit alpha n=2 Tax=Dendroctonus ponderosae TaxID=77166 RepID=U4UE38_DENPD|nr:hypothetical protein D910_07935 [Dendroctonus ponderosae]